MLIVNKNCINFLILSKIFLPYFMSSTMFSKLSSKIKPASDLRDCVDQFIAIPTSAIQMASEAELSTRETTSPSFRRPASNKHLSSSVTLVITFNSLAIIRNYSMSVISEKFQFSELFSLWQPPVIYFTPTYYLI